MRLKFYLSAIVLIACLPLYSQTCRELVWSDEFNYTGFPDSTKWSYQVGGGGFGNNEEQYYTGERPENGKVEDGRFIITAIRETGFGNEDFTSTKVHSRLKGDWLYGRIEVSAKLPVGRGTWPAIWMLPTNSSYGGWPASGEIDIMEHVGYDQNKVHGTVHTDAYNHTKNTQKGKNIVIPTASTEFHLYSVEWTPEKIDFFVDDVKYNTFLNENKTYSEWPFDKPFYVILNVAMGGNWGGAQGIDPDFVSSSMEIDYVRVYQEGEGHQISGPAEAAMAQANLTFTAPFGEKYTYNWQVPSDATIVSESDKNVVKVNWGCTAGKVIANVGGECAPYVYEHQVSIREPQIAGAKLVGADSTVTYEADSIEGASYIWSVPEGVTVVDGQGTNKVTLKWNDSNGTVSVAINNSCGTQNGSYKVFINGQLPFPNPEVPHTFPGEIVATDFDYGGVDVAYSDTDPTNVGPGVRKDEAVDTENNDNGNPNIGWIGNGEWLEYTVKIEETGWYEATIRAASGGSPDSLEILFDNVSKFGPVKVNTTGGWSTFTTLNLGKAQLEAGNYVMKYNLKRGGYNIGKLTVTKTTEPLGREDNKWDHVLIYPNPAEGKVYLKGLTNVSNISIIDALGKSYSAAFRREKADTYMITIKNGEGVFTIKAMSGKNIIYKRIILK